MATEPWTAYPGAVKRDQNHHQHPITHNAIIHHTMVGYLRSTDSMFATDLSFSHFGIGGKWGVDAHENLDGVVYQWMSLDYSAEANVDGNPYTISIETADNAPNLPSEIEPWTDKQLAAIIALDTWLCQKYDIPAILLPNTKAGSKGLGYHEQGAHSNLVPGGLYYGDHECPGPVREKQLKDIVIPAVEANLNGPSNLPAFSLEDFQTPMIAAAHGKTSVPLGHGALMHKALNMVGCNAGEGDRFSKFVVAAYSRWQQKQGFTGQAANGIPGAITLNALVEKTHLWRMK